MAHACASRRAAVLAGAGRCVVGLLLLHGQPARAGLVLRQVPRRSTPCWTTSTTWTSSTRSCSPAARALLGDGLWKVGDRGLIDGLVVNGSAKLVGWFATRRPHVPDRLHLPLRVRDDPRRAGDAAVLLPVLARLIQAKTKTMMQSHFYISSYLSLSIWLPILFGVLVLAVGRDKQRRLHPRAVAGRRHRQLPADDPADHAISTMPRTACSSSRRRPGSSASTSSTTSASTACRCGSCR